MSKEEFKILSPREHVRMRMNMYVGSSSLETVDRFILGKYKSVQYVPALVKIIDEILDNSIDESIRTEFKHANKIDITIKENAIIITDNGRGIPQDIVKDSDGNEILRPEAAWTRVNAGTSFSDDRVSIGANGVGSSCTNFLSKQFVGKTWRDGKQVTVSCNDGGLNTKVTTTPKEGSGTCVAFIPDFSLFEQKSIDEYDTIDIVKDRLLNMSMAFPNVKFTFNGKKVEGVSTFANYAEIFGIEGASRFVYNNSDLSFLITASEDGFRPNCYINGVNTRLGGAYVDFIVNGIVEELSVMIKRKYKITPNKSTIKNGMVFIMFAKNFTNPKYDSQTKERLTNTAGQVKQHFEANSKYDFNYIAKKLMAYDDFIKPLIDAQLAKQEADEIRDAELAEKKIKKIKVAKHVAASGDKNTTLFLVEGDSAMSSFINVRDSKTQGAFPLRGVPISAWDTKVSKILENEEIKNMIAILGLKLSDPKSYENMFYENIAILADADHDGEKIATLLVSFFYKFWPKLFDEGKVRITRTPIMISSKGKDVKWFYGYDDANEFKEKSSGYHHRYIKGLASLTREEYKEVISNPRFDVITIDKPELFDMMFGPDSDVRKEFIMS